MRLEEERVRTINGYRGIIVNTRLDYARLPDGSMALREVVEHPGGVAVLPLEADGTVWCVRQYRYPFSELLLEVPQEEVAPVREMLVREMEGVISLSVPLTVECNDGKTWLEAH